MRIAVGSDHRGYAIRGKLVGLLRGWGHEVLDVGTYTPDAADYPDIAWLVGRKVVDGEADRGILVCATGLGMCIAANKIAGIRAAPVHDELTAEMSRRHNDLNVLCLSADWIEERLMDRIVEIFLTTPFEGGRHARRVAKIAALEREAQARCEEHGSSSPPTP